MRAHACVKACRKLRAINKMVARNFENIRVPSVLRDCEIAAFEARYVLVKQGDKYLI